MPSGGVAMLPPSPSMGSSCRRGSISVADSSPRTQRGTMTGSPRTFSSPSRSHLGEDPVMRSLEGLAAAEAVAEAIHEVCQTLPRCRISERSVDETVGRRLQRCDRILLCGRGRGGAECENAGNDEDGTSHDGSVCGLLVQVCDPRDYAEPDRRAPAKHTPTQSRVTA